MVISVHKLTSHIHTGAYPILEKNGLKVSSQPA